MIPYFLFTESKTTKNEKLNVSPIVIHKNKRVGKIDELEINGFKVYSPKEMKLIDVSHISENPTGVDVTFLDEILIGFEMSYSDFTKITKCKKEISGMFANDKETYSFEGFIVNTEREGYFVNVIAKVSILIR